MKEILLGLVFFLVFLYGLVKLIIWVANFVSKLFSQRKKTAPALDQNLQAAGKVKTFTKETEPISAPVERKVEVPVTDPEAIRVEAPVTALDEIKVEAPAVKSTPIISTAKAPQPNSSKFNYITAADEEELEKLILLGDRKVILDWINKINSAKLAMPPKVFARAKAFAFGDKWLTDEEYEAKKAAPGYADDKLMEELETLLVTEDKKLVREFLKEYKDMEISLPPKVVAKAKAFLTGRAWKFEDEIIEVQAEEVKAPSKTINNSPYKKSIADLTFTAIDFETANKDRNSACSVGYIRVVNGEITEQGHSLIKPKSAKVSDVNYRVHGISDEDLATAPDFAAVWATLEPLISNQVVVAHNCSYDISVLTSTLEDHEIPLPELRYMCSQKLVQEAFSDLKNYRLDDVASYFGIELNHHDALSDAKVCALITINSLRSSCDFYFNFNHPELTEYISKRASETKKDRSLNGIYGKKKINTGLLKPNLEAANKKHAFYGKGIIFTGELETFNRQEAAEKALSVGAVIKSSISKLVHFVVIGENAGPAKLKKIEELQSKGCDIKMIDEIEFLTILNGSLTQQPVAV